MNISKIKLRLQSVISSLGSLVIVRYGLVGIACASVDLLIFTGLIYAHTPYLFANFVGYGTGTMLSFFINRKLTFIVHNRTLLRLTSFLLIGFIGVMTSSGLLWILVEQLNLFSVLAKILSIPIVFSIQFALNNWVTFRSKARANRYISLNK